MAKEKVVLAYSGGLDTSVIVKWLQEKYDYEIVAMTANVGQGDSELEGLEEKAIKTGASEVFVEDLREELVRDYIFPMVQSGAVYEGKYLLGTAIARPLIGKKLVEIAERVGAKAVAHGATGKGNDQVRFEFAVKALNPYLKIVAPWREWDLKGRSDCMDYACKHGISIPVTAEKPYSIDRNLWHISFEGGILEDPDREPEKDMYRLTVDPLDAPDQPEEVTISFERGIPFAVNGKKLSPAKLVEELNTIAGRHGVGRIDIVENRFLGMKSRGIYETPGGTLLTFAHGELEHYTLDRDLYHYKEGIALKYAEMIYYGLWFTPLREALDAFIQKTQETVTGTIGVKLYKGNISVSGRESAHTLYHHGMVTFEDDDLFEQKDAQGFINLYGLPMTIRGMVEMKARQKKEAAEN
ncbi:MAG: argininosuccinate synthase [Firmicutes bacterium ML8_F2]|jgi:argininosuccinate synthase|nr:MAG: argininosuccinate synthase [Firmicutes bacterium ML8_F2]